jgi:N-acetylmuramic acid 6-phosphate etherase
MRSGMSAAIPPTERASGRSKDLDLLETQELVELIVSDQRDAVEAVLSRKESIAQAVDAIAERLMRGGRLHYVGAGTSGRIATLDAAEMPPTFGTLPAMVRAHIAGGLPALTQPVEGAEDDAGAGEAAVRECVTSADALIGISASGGAPFVVAAVERARHLGAYTVAVTSVAESPLAAAAQLAIIVATGPEVLAGSTRLKAGTAQKIVLNAVSTAVMVRLAKTYGNFMVDLVASNQKLRARAVRLVGQIAGVDEKVAQRLLEEAGGRVKVAVVMERCGVDAAQAQALLERHRGALRKIL